MSGQNVGYIRVSSVDQNTARQLDGVSLDKVFEDKASGKDANRPQLIACMNHLREGDTLHIHSMDRLARNLLDMRKIVDELTSKGVTVRFIKEALTFSKDKADARSELMFNMMAAFAQFERELIKERQTLFCRKQGMIVCFRGSAESSQDSPIQSSRMALLIGLEQKIVFTSRSRSINRLMTTEEARGSQYSAHPPNEKKKCSNKSTI